MSLVTALFFGLAPALHLTNDRIAGGIREGGRGGAMGGRGRRLRNVLVVSETALAVVLLVGAGLLLRTLWNLQRIDPGFEAHGALIVNVGLPPATFATPAEQSHVLQRMIEEVAALPGVTSAGAITDLPMSGAINSTNVLRADAPPPPPSEQRHALVRAVSPSYFTTMGIPIVRGRAVEPTDIEGTPDVAVVNDRFAELWFRGEEAIGKFVNVRGVSAQIVGVVANVKEFTLEDGPDPVLYTAYSQEKQPWMRERMTLVAKTEARDLASLTRAVRSALRRAHPLVPVNRVRTLEDVVSAHVAEPRFRATVVLLFASIALLLAAVGVGGVMAYTVSQRIREIGLRIAIGAGPNDVMRMIVADSARLAVAGVFLGLFGALLGSRVLANFLFGVPPWDPAVFAAVALTLGGVAVLSSWVPARRAARVDPNVALRAE
jgi:putative ABC transport system permease protein